MCRKKLPNVSHCATKSSPLQAEAPPRAKRPPQQAPRASQTRMIRIRIHMSGHIRRLNTHIHDAYVTQRLHACNTFVTRLLQMQGRGRRVRQAPAPPTHHPRTTHAEAGRSSCRRGIGNIYIK